MTEYIFAIASHSKAFRSSDFPSTVSSEMEITRLDMTRVCGGGASRLSSPLVASPKFAGRSSYSTALPQQASLGPGSERLKLLVKTSPAPHHTTQRRSISRSSYKGFFTTDQTLETLADDLHSLLHSRTAGVLVAGCFTLMLLEPQPAYCEELSGSALDVFQSFLVSQSFLSEVCWGLISVCWGLVSATLAHSP